MANQEVGVRLTLRDELTRPLEKALATAEARLRAAEKSMANGAAVNPLEDDPGGKRRQKDAGKANWLISQARVGDPNMHFTRFVSKVRNEFEGLVTSGEKIPDALSQVSKKFGQITTAMLLDVEKLSNPNRASRFVKAATPDSPRRLLNFEGMLTSAAADAASTLRTLHTGTGPFNRAFIRQREATLSGFSQAAQSGEAFKNITKPTYRPVSARDSASVFMAEFDKQAKDQALLNSKSAEGFSNLVKPAHMRKSAKASASVFMAAFAKEAEDQALMNSKAAESFSNLMKPTHLRKSAKESAAVFAAALDAEMANAEFFARNNKRFDSVNKKNWTTLDLKQRYTHASSLMSGEGTDLFDLKQRRKAAGVIASMGVRNLAPMIGEDAARQKVAQAIEQQQLLAAEIHKTVQAARQADRLNGQATGNQVKQQRELAAAHRKASHEIQRDWHDVTRGVAGGMGQMWMSWGQFIPLMTGFALTAGTAQLVRMTAELEKQAAIIRTASEADFANASTAEVSQEILRINKGSGVSIADTAKTYQAMIKADLSRQEAESATKISTMLSKVTGGELTAVDAGESLASLGAIFDEKNYELLADKMKYAADNSKTSLGQIVESMKQASTISRQYGYSLEGTLGLLMKMAEVGITGSAAGTAIRNMATDLGGRTKQSRKLIAQISDVTGVNISAYDKDGKQREEAEVIDSVAKALAGATDQQKQYILHTVMSERGSKALIPVLVDYGKSLGQLKTELEGVSGTLRRSYDVYSKTMSERTSVLANNMLNAAVEKFMANSAESLSSLLLSVERLSESDGFSSFLDAATKGMSMLFTSIKFVVDNLEIFAALLGGKLLVSGIKTAGALLGMASSFVKLGGSMSTAAAGATAATGAVTGFARFLPMLGGPIGVAISAIGLLGLAFATAATDAEKAQKRIASAAREAALAFRQGRQQSLLDESKAKYTYAMQNVDVMNNQVDSKYSEMLTKPYFKRQLDAVSGDKAARAAKEKELRGKAFDAVWSSLSDQAKADYNRAVTEGAQAAEVVKALGSEAGKSMAEQRGEYGPPRPRKLPVAKQTREGKPNPDLPSGEVESASRGSRGPNMRAIADVESMVEKLAGYNQKANQFAKDDLQKQIDAQFAMGEAANHLQLQRMAEYELLERQLELKKQIAAIDKDIDATENKTAAQLQAIVDDKNAKAEQRAAAQRDLNMLPEVQAAQRAEKFRLESQLAGLQPIASPELMQKSQATFLESVVNAWKPAIRSGEEAAEQAKLTADLNAAMSTQTADSLREQVILSRKAIEAEVALARIRLEAADRVVKADGFTTATQEVQQKYLDELSQAQRELQRKEAEAKIISRDQLRQFTMNQRGNEGDKFMVTLLDRLDTWALKMPSFGKALADGFSEGVETVTKGWLDLLVNGKQSGEDQFKSEANAEKLKAAERRLAEIDRETPLVAPGANATQGDYDRYNRLNSERNERRNKTIEEIDQLKAEQKQLESTKNSMSKIFAEGAQKLQDSLLNYVGESINQIIFGGIGELFGGRTSIEMQLISALNANTAALQGKSAAASSGGGGGWLSSLFDIGSSLIGGFFGAGDVLSTGLGGSGTLGGDSFMPKDFLGYSGLEMFKNGGVMTDFGRLPLRKYAKGGIARSPQVALFGEAGPEAYVPLPDGNRIPVSLSGGTGGVTVIISPNIDARGADAGAVKRLENAITVLADNVVPMAVQGVRKEMMKNRRTPDF